jgi:hypothetical protein
LVVVEESGQQPYSVVEELDQNYLAVLELMHYSVALGSKNLQVGLVFEQHYLVEAGSVQNSSGEQEFQENSLVEGEFLENSLEEVESLLY